jgi:Ca2+-binding EF-hand superfamily protein
MKFLFLLLPLVLVGCATQNPSLESRFNAADANGDGLLSRREATNVMIAQVFEMYDSNGDGVVEEAEFVAGGGDAAKFRDATEGTTGGLSLAEAQAKPAIIETMAVPFDEADVDGNGTISFQELEAYQALLEATVR